jgi:hypothetical protein
MDMVPGCSLQLQRGRSDSHWREGLECHAKSRAEDSSHIIVTPNSRLMASTSGSQPQQVNVADLDLQQLSDVRRQLEEVPVQCDIFLRL